MAGSFEGTLANIPGLGGYLASQNQRQQADAQSLSQIGVLSQLQAQMAARQKAEQDQARQEQFRAALTAAGGDPAKARQAIMQFGSPAEMLKAGEGQSIGSGGLRMPDGTIVAPAARPETQRPTPIGAGGLLMPDQTVVPPVARPATPQPSQIARLLEERNKLPPGDPRISVYDNAIRKESETAKQISPTVVMPRDTPHPVVGVDDKGNQVINFVRPSQGSQTLTTRPVGSANVQARIDNSRAAQIQSRYSTTAKPILDSLNSVEMYREFRNQGDFAQAGAMAAEALRRAARGGTARFKGEAAALLGSGYGSGNLADRMENFISQQFSRGGGPTKDTLAKMDKLIEAAEEADFGSLARTARFFAAQVQGQPGLKLSNAIGAPFVSGPNVVFPDGTYAKFKDAKEASDRAQKWMESN